MRAGIHGLASVLLALATVAGPMLSAARGQAPAPGEDPAAQVAAAVTRDPDRAVQIVVDAVARSAAKEAPAIVAAAVGALSPAQRKAFAPAVVGSAIRALPAEDRVGLAPGCACAAVRSIPPLEQREVVPPVVVAAVNAAPEARPRIRECAIDAAPAVASQINAVVAAAAAPLPLVDADATAGSPLPGNSLGQDALQRQRCASPPCPG
ncbi:MAG TPA: hypothetical protein VFN71_06615 [Methylomirabilota bacterium]|nr:hypothetical protein [Methylomirabilota bacterium]